MMKNIVNPSQCKLMEHVESQYDLNNPLFDDYFSILEWNVSKNISFIDRVQYEILDLNVEVLTIENSRYGEHNELENIHEEVLENEQHITI